MSPKAQARLERDKLEIEARWRRYERALLKAIAGVVNDQGRYDVQTLIEAAGMPRNKYEHAVFRLRQSGRWPYKGGIYSRTETPEPDEPTGGTELATIEAVIKTIGDLAEQRTAEAERDRRARVLTRLPESPIGRRKHAAEQTAPVVVEAFDRAIVRQYVRDWKRTRRKAS